MILVTQAAYVQCYLGYAPKLFIDFSVYFHLSVYFFIHLFSFIFLFQVNDTNQPKEREKRYIERQG